MSLSDEEFWNGVEKLARKVEADVDKYDELIDITDSVEPDEKAGPVLEEMIKNHDTFEDEDFYITVVYEIRDRRNSKDFLQKWKERVY